MKWICRVCGYVHDGSKPPDECPICFVGSYAFDEGTEISEKEKTPQAEKVSTEDILKKSVDEILKQAAAKEQEAFEFYKNALEIVKDAGAIQLIDELAKEELAHKERLENFKPGDLKDCELKKIQDLRISEFLVEEEITDKTGFQGVLIKAMKKEQNAYEFFSRMSAAVEDKEVKRLFEILANEELEHKNRLEKYYDDVVYSEN
ncbi:MAG: rubredoxin-like domain-containing protein [Candidatus Anammoxibacter sp.]